jgi:hypothetical protein
LSTSYCTCEMDSSFDPRRLRLLARLLRTTRAQVTPVALTNGSRASS